MKGNPGSRAKSSTSDRFLYSRRNRTLLLNKRLPSKIPVSEEDSLRIQVSRTWRQPAGVVPHPSSMWKYQNSLELARSCPLRNSRQRRTTETRNIASLRLYENVGKMDISVSSCTVKETTCGLLLARDLFSAIVLVDDKGCAETKYEELHTI